MRYALRILGFLLLAMGIVWFLQGINVLPGSFMTGQIQWAWRGGATAILGLAILFLSARASKPS